ncbi:hypothetical protein GCM10010208_67130 [Actinomadura livida]|nr:hypothetical protein GCM10010208_67130 [Actinomadura livida]
MCFLLVRALGARTNKKHVRSLHRFDSPSGSLRDQVSCFARNLPSDAIATVGVVAWLRWWLMPVRPWADVGADGAAGRWWRHSGARAIKVHSLTCGVLLLRSVP